MALDLPTYVALIGGLIWGIAILNLDRWLIVSTPRFANWWRTLLMAMPRVLFAVIVGAVISTPLTLQIFNREVAAQIQTMHAEDQAEFEHQLSVDPRFSGLPQMKSQIAALQHQIAAGSAPGGVVQNPEVVLLRQNYEALTTEYNAAEQAVACERDGTCGSGQVGAGPAFAEKKARRDRLASERNAALAQLNAKMAEVTAALARTTAIEKADRTEQLEALQAKVGQAEAERDREVAAKARAVAADTGLLARLEALHRLEQDRPELAFDHRMLFLFLTVIECMPVLFKTLLSLARPSTYESLMMMQNDRLVDRATLRLDLRRWEAERSAQLHLEQVEARSRTTMEAEIGAAKVILDAQLALVRQSVEKWQAHQAAIVEATDVIDLQTGVRAESPFGEARVQF
jgi:hypothetical protein